uniref:Peptidase C1A papain C-terminal domain-containing protein n=1 Tax=Tetradesmus obliquus TaxID=3088 RepID=A0A383WER1_TETOB|eukprot:jgi/Sobl393_1/19386/SZX76108.1
MAKVKEQIMLTGGVLASMAMSPKAFASFVANKTAANGIFTTTEDARRLNPATTTMHAVFCYGWWDSPSALDDGYWICKNSWGPGWGLGGSFRVAYDSAYIMQPDYTFALEFNKANITQRLEDIRQRLKPHLSYDSSAAGCVLHAPRQPQRLLEFVQDLSILSSTLSMATRPRKADILADVLAFNLGWMHRLQLSAATRVPFRLCGRTKRLLYDILSPTMRPSPSPAVLPSPLPPTTPASPSPPPAAFKLLTIITCG